MLILTCWCFLLNQQRFLNYGSRPQVGQHTWISVYMLFMITYDKWFMYLFAFLYLISGVAKNIVMKNGGPESWTKNVQEALS